MADYLKKRDVIAYIRKEAAEAQRAFEELGGESGIIAEAYEDLASEFEDFPAADVVPVVRCPECKYHHDCGTHFCDRLGMDCPDDSEFFCKYGARMDGAE